MLNGMNSSNMKHCRKGKIKNRENYIIEMSNRSQIIYIYKSFIKLELK